MPEQGPQTSSAGFLWEASLPCCSRDLTPSSPFEQHPWPPRDIPPPVSGKDVEPSFAVQYDLSKTKELVVMETSSSSSWPCVSDRDVCGSPKEAVMRSNFDDERPEDVNHHKTSSNQCTINHSFTLLGVGGAGAEHNVLSSFCPTLIKCSLLCL